MTTNDDLLKMIEEAEVLIMLCDLTTSHQHVSLFLKPNRQEVPLQDVLEALGHADRLYEIIDDNPTSDQLAGLFVGQTARKYQRSVEASYFAYCALPEGSYKAIYRQLVGACEGMQHLADLLRKPIEYWIQWQVSESVWLTEHCIGCAIPQLEENTAP